jgi:hypothetical protein
MNRSVVGYGTAPVVFVSIAVKNAKNRCVRSLNANLIQYQNQASIQPLGRSPKQRA